MRHSHRRSLTHGHGLTTVTLVIEGRNANVADRNLPRSDKLVPRNQATDGAVAYRNQESFVGDRWKTQNPRTGFADINAGKVRCNRLGTTALNLHDGLRRFSK